ncbi:MAG: acetyl-CoA carboxylase biotin carboxyl carrier protein subunit [Gemmatimonadota bacterium]|jgi:pyruvate carboxylase subunit B|nr:acetyl-CoA carboxylase biotin carboxyl carrier protein subunit [Gemmatimonadota bacterium]
MKYFVTVGGVEVEVAIDPDGIRVDGELVDAALEPLAGTPLQQLRMGERTLVFSMESPERGEWALGYRGERWEASVVDERTRHIRSLTGEGRQRVGAGEVKAPMPGLVLRVLVGSGEQVEAGAGLVVLEAMKMENQIKAPAPGVVEAVRVEAGQAVEKGQILVVLAAPPSSPAGGGVA